MMQVTLTGEPAQDQKPPYRREEWLREQYVEQRKTTDEMADMADCAGSTVRRHLKKHGIEIRRANPLLPDKLRDEDWLREQYVGQRQSTNDIADMVDCSNRTVLTYLNRHGIETRGGDHQVSDKLRREDWLREQYVGQGKTMHEIADMAGCCDKTVYYYLNKYGVETRSRPNNRSGVDHPNYAGGDSTYGSGWNDNKKRAVRDRDGNACRNCGMRQEQHRRQYGRRLDVHHIKKAREFDDADKRNAMSNLITLCRDCHHSHFEKMAETGLKPQIPGVNAPSD